MPSLYDFVGLSDPFSDLFPGRQRYGSPLPTPTPEQEDALLTQLAGGGLSALGYVGETLDKPGAAVRGLLAGRPDQLLNLIPFSDMMGLTDPSQRVSGRDLLEQYGLLSANTPGLDVGDAAGFGAEVLLDPLTYLSFGASALTKAGKAADVAGTLAKASYGAGGELLQGARAAQMAAGQRALVGAGLPFMDNVAVAGTGPWAQKIAGGLDTTEHFLRFGNPIGRAIGGVFDPSVHDAMTQAGQVAMHELDPLLQGAEVEARARLIDRAQQLREMGFLTNNPAEAGQFRNYMETGQPLSEEFAQAGPVLDTLRSDLDQLLNTERQLAMQTPELSDEFVKYVPRQRTTFPSQGIGGKQRAFPTEHPFQTGREDFLKNIPGGTETINVMSLDPALSGAKDAPILQRMQTVKQAYGITDDGQAKDLAEWLGSLPAEHLQTKLPVFGNHPVYDILNRFVSGERAKTAVSGLYDFLGKNVDSVRTADNVPLGNVLEGAGLDRGRALYEFSQRFPNADIARSFVPKEIQADAARLMKGFSSPDPAGLVISALDKFTNAFKVSALTKPSRWTRDFYSGQFMNWVTGLFSPRGLSGAHSILTKGLDAVASGVEKIPEFAAKGLSPQQATQEIVKELFAHKILQPYGGEFADLIGPNVSGSKLMGEIPGGVPQTLRSTFVDPLLAKGRANPLRVRGVGMPGQIAHETQFAPAKISENVSHYTDGLNRIAPYIEGRLQGMSPEMAARKVKLAQVDYSRLTTTERKALKRVLPFYCVPDDSEIMTRDGWKSCDELVVGEEVLTYNVQDDCMEWQPCQDKAIFEHDQEIEVIQNRFQKIRCTSEHRWVAQHHKDYPVRLLPYEKISNGNLLRVAAPLRKGGQSLLTPKQARLLGWLLTDGYTRVRGEHVESVLYQHPNKFLPEVEDVAGREATWFHPDTGTAMIAVEPSRKKELIAIVGRDVLLKKTSVLPIIARLNHSAAKAMYDAMYKADGTVGTRTNDSFASLNKHIREAMQFLAYLLGYRCAECKRGVSISKRRGLKLEAQYRKKEHYKGRVWCPQTPNGTWLMRQGKFVGITGNTFTRRMIPTVFKELMEKPGGRLAQTIRAENLSRDDQFLPPYLAPGLAINLGEQPSGDTRYLTSIDLPHESVFQLYRPSNTAFGTVTDTLSGLAGQLNPLAKVPIELATGKQLYSGRDLADLNSRIGRALSPNTPPGVPILAEEILMNTPVASQVISTYGTFADPRKSWGDAFFNFASGSKISDVNVEKSRDRIASDAIQELMRNHPSVRTHSSMYVPRDLVDTLTPEEQLLLGEYAQIGQRARERARNAGAGRL